MNNNNNVIYAETLLQSNIFGHFKMITIYGSVMIHTANRSDIDVFCPAVLLVKSGSSMFAMTE